MTEDLKYIREVYDRRYNIKESAQNKIAEAICNLLRDELVHCKHGIDYPSLAIYSYCERGIDCQQKFWDEINEFPFIAIVAENHRFQFQGGGVTERFTQIRIRCFADSQQTRITVTDDLGTESAIERDYHERRPNRTSIDLIFMLLKDVETILEVFAPGLEYDRVFQYEFTEHTTASNNVTKLADNYSDEWTVPLDRNFIVPVRFYTINDEEYKLIELSDSIVRVKKDDDTLSLGGKGRTFLLYKKDEDKFTEFTFDEPSRDLDFDILRFLRTSDDTGWIEPTRYIMGIPQGESKPLRIEDMRLEGISTDEGVLDPRAVGDLVCEIRY